MITTYDYAPFGAVTQGGTNLDNAFQFCSEYADSELGLVYYNFRHYNPTDGRWINRDPIAEQGGYNLYAMVKNNAVNYSDSLGLAKLIMRNLYTCRKGCLTLLKTWFLYKEGDAYLDIPGVLTISENGIFIKSKEKTIPFQELLSVIDMKDLQEMAQWLNNYNKEKTIAAFKNNLQNQNELMTALENPDLSDEEVQDIAKEKVANILFKMKKRMGDAKSIYEGVLYGPLGALGYKVDATGFIISNTISGYDEIKKSLKKNGETIKALPSNLKCKNTKELIKILKKTNLRILIFLVIMSVQIKLSIKCKRRKYEFL